MKKVLITGLIILFTGNAFLYSQQSARLTTWFPKGNLFPTIRLDYKESQICGSLYAFQASGQWQNNFFGIFTLGLRNALIRWQQTPEKASELGFELAVFPQFVFEDPFGRFQTTLLNIDFKIGVHYQGRFDRWQFRGRIYHISAHLGDDYLIRNGIDQFIDNPRIYEVADFSAAWSEGPWQLYGTAGVIIHTAYPRKPLLVQTGVQFGKPAGQTAWLQWIAGADIRIEQEQDFRPGIRIGGGIGIGRNGRLPVIIMADYYNGYLPYSLYDRILIQWIGASLFFNPF